MFTIFCSIGSFSTTLFSARLALATGGQCGYQISAKFWNQSTAELDRGTRSGSRPGGSTEGGSIHINVYYNEATGDRYLHAQFAWTSTWKPWTAFVWDRSDKFSGLTTLCFDIRALARNWRRDTASFIWTRLSYQELTTLFLHDTI